MPVPAGKAPIIECVKEGFLFLKRDWRGILPIALAGAIVTTPLQVWAEVAQVRQDLGAVMLAAFLSFILQTPFLAAFLRRAVTRGEAPLAVRVGRDEANLIGAGLSVGFLFFIVVVIGGFVAILILAATLMGAGINAAALEGMAPDAAGQMIVDALGPAGIAVPLLAFLGLFVLLLWLSARLALVNPATVGEGRMLVFSTWSWTKDNALRIMAIILILVLLASAASVIVLAIPIAVTGAIFGSAETPGAPGHVVASFFSAFAAQALILAPYAAMSAYLYRGLRPSNFTPA